MPTAEELLKRGRRTLVAAADLLGRTGDEKEQARELLEFVLGREPDPDEPVPAAAARRFERYVERRATGEPIAYITGFTEFGSLRLEVKPGAFIPRATTEFLAEQAVRRLRRRGDPVAVDLATGIGPVALAVASAVRRADVHGVDLSPTAAGRARRNAKLLKLDNVRFHAGDLFSPLPSRLRHTVDVITFHPPYVPRADVPTLAAEISVFEPASTLTDGSVDGLGLVRRAADEAWDWLCAGGWICVEVDPPTAREVRAILVEAGFEQVRSTSGEMKHTRVVVGRAT